MPNAATCAETLGGGLCAAFSCDYYRFTVPIYFRAQACSAPRRKVFFALGRPAGVCCIGGLWWCGGVVAVHWLWWCGGVVAVIACQHHAMNVSSPPNASRAGERASNRLHHVFQPRRQSQFPFWLLLERLGDRRHVCGCMPVRLQLLSSKFKCTVRFCFYSFSQVRDGGLQAADLLLL